MNDWPKARWVALLQGVLTGTECNVYDSLSIEQSSDYNVVKDSILRAYECVPELYSVQFRGLKNKQIKLMLNLLEKKNSSLIDGVILNK